MFAFAAGGIAGATGACRTRNRSPDRFVRDASRNWPMPHCFRGGYSILGARGLLKGSPVDFMDALSVNLIPFAGLFFLLFIVRSNPLFDKKQTKLFTIAIGATLFMLLDISLDFVFSQRGSDGYAWAFRRVTSFFNFAAAPVVPFLLFSIFKKGKLAKLQYLPLLANVLICFLSLFFNVVFTITEANTYARGPLFFVPIGISVFYIVMLIARLGTVHTRQKKTERLFLLCVIVLLAIGMWMEIGLSYRFISWDCSAVAIIAYYLLLNVHYSTLDTLTSIYSRSVYAKEIEAMERSAHPRIIALADINDFKSINDRFGHDVGDEHLVSFAEILTVSFAGVATPYRIGGDEFALIAKDDDVAAFESALADARGEAKRRGIDFACGFEVYRPGGAKADETIRDIDQAMYRNKRAMKESL